MSRAVGKLPPRLARPSQFSWRAERRDVVVTVPCGSCAHHGLCSIEQAIENDLVLRITDVGQPVELAITCSIFEAESEAGRRLATRQRQSAAQKAKWASKTPEERADWINRIQRGRKSRTTQSKSNRVA